MGIQAPAETVPQKRALRMTARPRISFPFRCFHEYTRLIPLLSTSNAVAIRAIALPSIWICHIYKSSCLRKTFLRIAISSVSTPAYIISVILSSFHALSLTLKHPPGSQIASLSLPVVPRDHLRAPGDHTLENQPYTVLPIP